MTFTISPALAWVIFQHESESLSDRVVVLNARLNRLEASTRYLIRNNSRSHYTEDQDALTESLERARSDFLRASDTLDTVNLHEEGRYGFLHLPGRDVALRSRLREVERLLSRSEHHARDVESGLR